MKPLSLGMLALGMSGMIVFALVGPGAPLEASTTLVPPSVSAGGFTLTSPSVDLPVDETGYPDGPHADVINANCTACHSASMATSQPALTQDQWKAVVAKMVETYKAPIDAQDIPAIVSYLVAMSAKLPGAAKTAPANGNRLAGHGDAATG